jgi:hypothetical protein
MQQREIRQRKLWASCMYLSFSLFIRISIPLAQGIRLSQSKWSCDGCLPLAADRSAAVVAFLLCWHVRACGSSLNLSCFSQVISPLSPLNWWCSARLKNKHQLLHPMCLAGLGHDECMTFQKMYPGGQVEMIVYYCIRYRGGGGGGSLTGFASHSSLLHVFRPDHQFCIQHVDC